MRVGSTDVAERRLELRRPLVAGRASYAARDVLEVVVLAGPGLFGLGEAAPLPAFGTETLSECRLALGAALGELPGLEVPTSAAEVKGLVDTLGTLARAPAARHAVELALLDLAARSRGLNLATLLHPRPRRVVVVSALVALDRLLEEAREATSAGHRVLKVKVGTVDPLSHTELLRALRRELGDAVAVRLDANGAWSEATALAALRAWAPLGLELCEQPVAAAEVDALSRLRRAALCPVAADEVLATAAGREAVFDSPAGPACDVAVLKPMVLGGLLPALELAQRCGRLGVEAYVTTSLDGEVARTAATHLAAAIPQSRFASGLRTGRLFGNEALRRPLALAGAEVQLGKDAGLGLAPLERAKVPRRPGPVGAPCPLRSAALRAPKQTGLLFEGQRWTFRELDLAAARAAAWLVLQGVLAGDRVAVLGPSGPELLALLFAAGRLGATLAPLSARLGRRELESQLSVLGARVLVQLGKDSAGLAGAQSFTLAHAPPDGLAGGEWSASSPWVALFTSGTSGVAKAAQLTGANFLAMAAATGELIGVRESDRSLLCLPMFHVGGLALAVRSVVAGGELELHPRFDAAAVSAALDAGAAHLSLVATTLRWLLETRAGRAFPSSLRSVLVGGGPTPPRLLDAARALGAPVLQTYGLTEACSQVATERPDEADGRSAGPPIPGVEVRVVNGLGRPLPSDEVGEIEVKGPTVFHGYLPSATAHEPPLRDGWLRTFDLGALDRRGRLHPVGRRQDLIISGGENVYPAEVEAVLGENPDVAAAVVLGVPDAEWGQVPLAWIERRRPDLSPDELRRWCKERLAGFKIPRRFCLVEALPRTPSGKLDRAALREQRDFGPASA